MYNVEVFRENTLVYTRWVFTKEQLSVLKRIVIQKISKNDYIVISKLESDYSEHRVMESYRKITNT